MKFVAFFVLVLTASTFSVFAGYSEQSSPIKPKWAERYIIQYYPKLLTDTESDHVLAFYYFGRWKNFSIMGMERIRGEDYEHYNTVLVFESETLIGIYPEVPVFPFSVSEAGIVTFPNNAGVKDVIDLAADDYPEIRFPEKTVAFIPAALLEE